ncbi:MAG: hypothetical protein LBD34_02435 [Puniceicoccales bacterium]|jgi:hypothetical protein|nr:hypothetical protein [Puniceicoccales bacterium]
MEKYASVAGGDGDGRGGDVGTTVIAGGDGAPILPSTDHIFNFMASFVGICVVRELDLAADYKGYTRFCPVLSQPFPEPVGTPYPLKNMQPPVNLLTDCLFLILILPRNQVSFNSSA